LIEFESYSGQDQLGPRKPTAGSLKLRLSILHGELRESGTTSYVGDFLRTAVMNGDAHAQIFCGSNTPPRFIILPIAFNLSHHSLKGGYK
jgi:hypothetical protein